MQHFLVCCEQLASRRDLRLDLRGVPRHRGVEFAEVKYRLDASAALRRLAPATWSCFLPIYYLPWRRRFMVLDGISD